MFVTLEVEKTTPTLEALHDTVHVSDVALTIYLSNGRQSCFKFCCTVEFYEFKQKHRSFLCICQHLCPLPWSLGPFLLGSWPWTGSLCLVVVLQPSCSVTPSTEAWLVSTLLKEEFKNRFPEIFSLKYCYIYRVFTGVRSLTRCSRKHIFSDCWSVQTMKSRTSKHFCNE